MFNYYFLIGLIYLLIAFIFSFIAFFILKSDFLGKFWGAAVIGLVGAFIGGIVGFIFDDVIEALTQINGSINIFPPICGTIIILWLFSKLKQKG